jgi:hypothetical protein
VQLHTRSRASARSMTSGCDRNITSASLI